MCCAVVNAGGAIEPCARFLEKDDEPVKAFTIDLGEDVKHHVAKLHEGFAGG